MTNNPYRIGHGYDVHRLAENRKLIIGGTSLVVYPAASLYRYFKGNTLVVINKSETQADSFADIVINEPIGKVFKEIV